MLFVSFVGFSLYFLVWRTYVDAKFKEHEDIILNLNNLLKDKQNELITNEEQFFILRDQMKAIQEKTQEQHLQIQKQKKEIDTLTSQIKTETEDENEEDRFPPDFLFPRPNGRFEPPLNLEGFPNMLGPVFTDENTKSLIAIPVGEKAKESIDKWVQKFGTKDFKFVFFVYDNSSWSQFEWHKEVIFIHYPKQIKWWYIKRFITPQVVDAYKLVIFADDDVDVEHMDPIGLVEVFLKNELEVAQPAHRKGHPISHYITLQVEGNHIGRWTNFCEIGPVLLFSPQAYQCAYHLIQIDLASGWGYDTLWTKFCKFKRVAIIDKYPLIHVSRRGISVDGDKSDLLFGEMGVLLNRYSMISPVQFSQFGYF